MKLVSFVPIILLFLFGLINLIGMRQDLAITSLIHFSLGVIVFFGIRYLQMQLHFFRNNALFFYAFFLVLLIITYFFGMEIKGSRRWIDLILFPLQTSEIFKVFFIVFLADFFAKIRTPGDRIHLFLKTLGFTLIPFVLILRQPDLGTSLIVFAIFLVMAFHSEIPKKQIFSFFLIVLMLLPLAWFGLHDYQKNRILSFVNPGHDASGTSYNMAQASIAIGAGQFLGKGLGMGKQSLLSFLPEFHTDFAFSSLIEQFGFVGGFIVILLYLWFFYVLFYHMGRHMGKKDYDDRYTFYYILGFSVMMISQTAINIGMNVGLLPVAGMTLPFISYGGSSLMTFMIAMALIPRETR